MKNRTNKSLFIFIAIVVIVSGCKKVALINGGNGLEDWTPSTHGYGATPNYNVVFNQDEVHRLDIVIEPEYWDAMQEDIASIYSTSSGPGGPGGPGGGGTDETPIYVPCQLFYNGIQWYDVGIRYKGNSSLSSSYTSGNGKLPLRIEMNHFENENPNINGQTFYGFTQLSLSSNFKDESFLHEKVAADAFRDFGVPAPQSAFYRIFVDYGEGPVYFGLYTMLEVVFDSPMLNKQFGSSYGNCYKPDGDGAKMNDISAINSNYFPNKTNSGAALDDIHAMVTALLDDSRVTNPSNWRANLESKLDVNLFLKWLAANTTMKNWDTYGKMTHNFYLYNNPSNDLLSWIPWDNNETFSVPLGGPGGSDVLAFDFSNLATTPTGPAGDPTWPLISYLYNDPIYKTKYDNYIDEFITSVFTVSNMSNKFTEAHDLIAPYVTGAEGEIAGYTHLTNPSNFDNSLADLINYVSNRVVEADAYTP